MTTAPVPVLWEEVPGMWRCAGALVVGVGASDLEIGSVGVHHLVEHLVMRRVGPLPFATNAVSTPDSVVFGATGTREQVLGFLRAVAIAIRSVRRGLGSAVLERERRVLATEEAGRGGGRPGGWTARYGLAGPGLCELAEIGAARATVDDVVGFATEWLVAANARVVLTFDPGDGTGVELPDTPPPARRRWRAATRSSRPVLASTETDSVTLSVDGIEAPGDVLVYEVLSRCLHRDLRDEHALIYSVAMSMCATGPRRRGVLVSLDPLPEAIDATVWRAHTVSRALALAGPDQAVLDDARAAVLAELDTPDDRFARLQADAVRELRGEEPADRGRTLAAVEQMTPGAVRDRWARLATGLVLTAPVWAELGTETMSELAGAGLRRRDLLRTDRRTAVDIRIELLAQNRADSSGRRRPWRPHRGYYPKVFGPVRGIHLWIGPGQMSLYVRDRPTIHIRASEVVLVATEADGEVTLVTRDGGRLTVNPRHFRGANRWWPHFWQHLPADVVRLPDPAPA